MGDACHHPVTDSFTAPLLHAVANDSPTARVRKGENLDWNPLFHTDLGSPGMEDFSPHMGKLHNFPVGKRFEGGSLRHKLRICRFHPVHIGVDLQTLCFQGHTEYRGGGITASPTKGCYCPGLGHSLETGYNRNLPFPQNRQETLTLHPYHASTSVGIVGVNPTLPASHGNCRQA